MFGGIKLNANNLFSCSMVILVVTVFSVLTYSDSRKAARIQEANLTNEQRQIDSQLIMGRIREYRGSKNAPYTIVEFGDYQCPPCRAMNPRIIPILNKWPGKIKLCFRNYPLINLHEYALSNAIGAEAAREQGRFWQAHDWLYSRELDSGSQQAMAKALHLNLKQYNKSCEGHAKAVVSTDLALATKLQLAGTPSFVLCTPQGTVYCLKNLDEIGNFVR